MWTMNPQIAGTSTGALVLRACFETFGEPVRAILCPSTYATRLYGTLDKQVFPTARRAAGP